MDNLNIPTLFNDPRWQRALADYLRSVYERSRSMASFRSYSYVLRYFFSQSANAGPAKHPARYSRADVEWFLHCSLQKSRRGSQEPSVGTRNQRLKVLRTFYKFVSEYTVAGIDGPERLFQGIPPTMGIRRAKMSEPKPKAMSLPEVQKLFAAIDTATVQGARDYCIFTFLLYTCRRREEICRLRWGDIERGTIIDQDGDMHEGYLYRYSEKGGGGSIKSMELPEVCYTTLERYLVASGRMASIRPEDPLFIAVGSKNGGGRRRAPGLPMDSDTIASSLKQLVKKAGLDPKRISLHSFRHTGIQLRLATGQEMMSVMRISGHKSLDVFYGYAKRLMGTADNHAKRLEDKLASLGVK
jgi:integrase